MTIKSDDDWNFCYMLLSLKEKHTLNDIEIIDPSGAKAINLQSHKKTK